MNKKWYIVGTLGRHDEFIIYDYPENVRIVNAGGKYSRIHLPGDTLEEMKEKNQVPEWECSKCGGVVSLSYYSRKRLEELKMCIGCQIWHDRIKDQKNKNVVVIDNELYTIARDIGGERKYMGHGGRLFKIKIIETGEIIETRNLWAGGTVPEIFRNDFPITAEFVKI